MRDRGIYAHACCLNMNLQLSNLQVAQGARCEYGVIYSPRVGTYTCTIAYLESKDEERTFAVSCGRGIAAA